MWWKFSSPSLIVILFRFGRGRGEDVASGWPSSWTWAVGGTSLLLLSSKCTFCLQFPERELFSRIQPWECKVLWRPSGLILWLNPVKSSIHTFNHLTGKYGTMSYVMQNMSYVFPCLLNLLPTNLEWPVSFFSVSLLCMYRHQFINQ